MNGLPPISKSIIDNFPDRKPGEMGNNFLVLCSYEQAYGDAEKRDELTKSD